MKKEKVLATIISIQIGLEFASEIGNLATIGGAKVVTLSGEIKK